MAKTGQIDAVITEDGDLIVHGCPLILFKLTIDGMCQEFRQESILSQAWAGIKWSKHAS